MILVTGLFITHLLRLFRDRSHEIFCVARNAFYFNQKGYAKYLIEGDGNSDRLTVDVLIEALMSCNVYAGVLLVTGFNFKVS
jgi:hypothetical protein